MEEVEEEEGVEEEEEEVEEEEGVEGSFDYTMYYISRLHTNQCPYVSISLLFQEKKILQIHNYTM